MASTVQLAGAIVIALTGFVSSSLAQNSESTPPDLRNGATFTFRIHPDLPAFRFVVHSNGEAPDDFGRPRAAVTGIDVFKDRSKQLLQHLEGCPWDETEPPSSPEWFRAEDLNFDGYKDIYFLKFAAANVGGCIWLYDRTVGRFKYSSAFSERLSWYWLRPVDRTILSETSGGGGTYIAERFKVFGDDLELIWSEERSFDGKEDRCVVKERNGQKMVVVFETQDSGKTGRPGLCRDRPPSEMNAITHRN